MTAAELADRLKGHGDLPVYFRCRAPVIGNVSEVESVELTSFAMFGAKEPCILLDKVIDVQ